MTNNDIRAKFIRLKNGDDLVCECYEYSDDNGDFITLINPLKALYVDGTHTGYLQIAFIPWVYPRICDVQEFSLAIEDVLFTQDVTDYMNEYYWSSLESFLNEKREEPSEKEMKEKIKEALENLEIYSKDKVYH